MPKRADRRPAPEPTVMRLVEVEAGRRIRVEGITTAASGHGGRPCVRIGHDVVPMPGYALVELID